MEYIFAVALFAFSTSITPGPNNIMVMTSGVNFGVKKTLPLLSGICVGFSVMLMVVGLGFGQLFSLFPSLHFIIKCAGVLYLFYLAWLIARTAAGELEHKTQQPMTFINGALFQWVNAKAWIVATGAIAAFTTVGEGYLLQNITIALVFLVAAFPCVGSWLLCGTALKRVFTQGKARQVFNYVMAGLLVLSVVPVISEIFTQVKKSML
ncbi:LysE family translocator [Pseudoalteromonas luteoviolacea]|uniref:Amino acid transporter LysE n=1 Tax=Pseudoalteromonas luteoviolacea S4054 TaxID=1129367 RepID=A0A0F6A6U7_9GAMM|nr:LysE family translocator [Pseudoalteromonas luteoviolacea]AOT07754.1 lysine transporter LysE [Pseudoalteromonas luteoviolacea]AOT12670.1 lysine transporter LysE [Pseudoalteromonas luteoviolacea]AOT17583.1 lysine transporter LysE [Pseudoalteromonas luteoviolacea]KKE81576.1 hypothetical protein N479_22020 [Pseudoalteromonas luteoviolacea S4054]KZN78888.1 hypothetical protein N481_00165 [Pseudoalteromonas luteoviolacea S4047-1]